MVLYCDSSLMECCVHDGKGYCVQEYPAPVTSNTGEYLAVIAALDIAKRFMHLDHVEIYTDSLLVVSQVNGNWKCRKPHLQSLRDRVQSKSKEFKSFKIKWISREVNPAGKVLEGLKHAVPS